VSCIFAEKGLQKTTMKLEKADNSKELCLKRAEMNVSFRPYHQTQNFITKVDNAIPSVFLERLPNNYFIADIIFHYLITSCLF